MSNLLDQRIAEKTSRIEELKTLQRDGQPTFDPYELNRLQLELESDLRKKALREEGNQPPPMVTK